MNSERETGSLRDPFLLHPPNGEELWDRAETDPVSYSLFYPTDSEQSFRPAHWSRLSMSSEPDEVARMVDVISTPPFDARLHGEVEAEM